MMYGQRNAALCCVVQCVLNHLCGNKKVFVVTANNTSFLRNKEAIRFEKTAIEMKC